MSTSIVSRASQRTSEPAFAAQPTLIELFLGLQRAVLVASAVPFALSPAWARTARPPMIEPWRANQACSVAEEDRYEKSQA